MYLYILNRPFLSVLKTASKKTGTTSVNRDELLSGFLKLHLLIDKHAVLFEYKYIKEVKYQ